MCPPVDKDTYAFSKYTYETRMHTHINLWGAYLYCIPCYTGSFSKTGNYFLQECPRYLVKLSWLSQYLPKVNQCLEKSIIMIACMSRVLTMWQVLWFVSSTLRECSASTTTVWGRYCYYLHFADKKIQTWMLANLPKTSQLRSSRSTTARCDLTPVSFILFT